MTDTTPDRSDFSKASPRTEPTRDEMIVAAEKIVAAGPEAAEKAYLEHQTKAPDPIVVGNMAQVQHPPSSEALRVTLDIWAERRRQEAKWGPQDLDFGYYQGIFLEELGEANKEWIEAVAKEKRAVRATNNADNTLADVLLADAVEHRRNLRVELVQALAVLHAMVECGDRNGWWPKP